jgi:hypothetical protein
MSGITCEDRQELRETMDKLDLPGGMSVIARTAGIGRNVDELQWDLNYLMQLWRAIEVDGSIADIDAFLEVGAGNFLEWQEAVTFFAVVDEAGFERRLDAGNHAFVDIRLALFASGRFDVDIDQFLTVDDGYAQFFLLPVDAVEPDCRFANL